MGDGPSARPDMDRALDGWGRAGADGFGVEHLRFERLLQRRIFFSFCRAA
ncbi:hypothetical protein APED_02425 [Acanthopleuribacter pedis]